NNAFQRKYSPHGLEELGNIPLESNSFYIAGIDDSMIYLGNYYAPLYLKAIDIHSKTSKDIKIEIENYELPYKRVRIEVNPPYFFVGDGTIPILFRGKISDWQAKTFSHSDAHFYQFAAIDSTSIVLSTTSSKTKMNVLGTLQNDQDKTTFNLNSKILKKQSSGTFDTDGILLWNNQHQYMLYVYYYRNQFEITNKQLQFQYTGKTIDTIKQAQINVDYYQKDAQYKIGKAIIVNRHASTYGNLLYINSDHLGKYEDGEILKSASIIDQYQFTNNTYVQSFYFYHQPYKKIDDFKVFRDYNFSLVDDLRWIYQIKPEYNQN